MCSRQVRSAAANTFLNNHVQSLGHLSQVRSTKDSLALGVRQVPSHPNAQGQQPQAQNKLGRTQACPINSVFKPSFSTSALLQKLAGLSRCLHQMTRSPCPEMGQRQEKAQPPRHGTCSTM